MGKIGCNCGDNHGHQHKHRVLGVLTAITQELYRKIIGPYEDIKIKENGDVE